ncbi:MAG TPA: glycosyltransferase family 2 protein [Candidatus Dormibacteraeota bacterium]|nr:glycosyltransferase family 2 protein [Candidatus Dormibacteraeota bacterium]
MSGAPWLTVMVLARDAEARIGACLDSLAPLGAEIVVVDDQSRDRTIAVAEARGARVITHPMADFAQQRNLAIDGSSGDWIMAVDSDETAPPELLAEVRQLIANPGAVVAARISLLNHLLGRPLWHAEDRPAIRLFRRGAGRFAGGTHEKLELPDGAAVVKLRHRLVHHPYPTIADLVRKQNFYTDRDHGLPEHGALHDLVLLPGRRFLSSYLRSQGFRDGIAGFAWSVFTGFYMFLLGVKRIEARQAAARAAEGRAGASSQAGPPEDR